jgi:hypothetical protein
MDEIYYAMVSFDYPTAISGGLKRTADVTRSLIERTRGDLTVAARQDVLQHALHDLERKLEAHPELSDPDSPTRRVGAEPVAEFGTVVRDVPMLSLQNAFSEEELHEFDSRVRRFLAGRGVPADALDRSGYVAEVKIDAFPFKKYRGWISFISQQTEFTPKYIQTTKERVKYVYRIKVKCDNSSLELKPGMPADAAIQTGR